MKRNRLPKTLAVVMTIALALVIIGVSGKALANVDSVTITPNAGESYTIPVGGVVHLNGAMAQSGTVTTTPVLTWTKNNDNVSLSDTTGATTTVTGIHPGTSVVTLTGTDDGDTVGKTTTATITVAGMGISNASLTLDGGATYALTVNNVLAGSVTWNSSNSTLVSVDASGVITAKGATQAALPVTITATSTPASGDVQTKTCAVTVNPKVTVTPTTQNITAASTTGTPIVLKVEYGGDLITGASTVTWANSNTSIGTLSAPSAFTVSGTALTCTATFTSSATAANGSATASATIRGTGDYTKTMTSAINVQTSRYLTLDGPATLSNTSRTGTYTVTLREANGTVVDNDTSTVHWSWSSSYLKITSDDLNDDRADMENGTAQIQLYAKYNTPSAGTKLYVWIDSDTGGKISRTITISGLSSLPQTGQDFTLAYVFGGLCLTLLATVGVLYGIRKKRVKA